MRLAELEAYSRKKKKRVIYHAFTSKNHTQAYATTRFFFFNNKPGVWSFLWRIIGTCIVSSGLKSQTSTYGYVTKWPWHIYQSHLLKTSTCLSVSYQKSVNWILLSFDFTHDEAGVYTKVVLFPLIEILKPWLILVDCGLWWFKHHLSLLNTQHKVL